MICHQYRCVFIHIPKTGGISVDHVFLRSGGPDLGHPRAAAAARQRRPGEGPAAPRPSQGDRIRLLRPPEPGAVRSVLQVLVRAQPLGSDRLGIQVPRPPDADELQDLARSNICRSRASRMRTVTSCPSTSSSTTRRAGSCADFVGRYESLQADFDIVCERIGIPRTPLPHENRSMDAPRIRSLNDVKKRIRRWLWTLRPTNVFPALYRLLRRRIARVRDRALPQGHRVVPLCLRGTRADRVPPLPASARHRMSAAAGSPTVKWLFSFPTGLGISHWTAEHNTCCESSASIAGPVRANSRSQVSNVRDPTRGRHVDGVVRRQTF